MPPASIGGVGGPTVLRPREQQIMTLRAQGLDNLEIAHLLGIQEQTVKNQQATAYKRLGVTNIVEAMWKLGWVKLT